MRINGIPDVYIPKQIRPFNIENLEKVQVEAKEIVRKPIIKNKPDYENFPERPLSETIENYLNIVRNIKYNKVKWDVLYHEHNGKIYEYKYSKELDIGFYKADFDNKLNPAYNNNFIDIYI